MELKDTFLKNRGVKEGVPPYAFFGYFLGMQESNVKKESTI